jgi:mRNA interferase RelE/StbE
MSYKLKYHVDVEEDFKQFDRSIVIKILKQIQKLTVTPKLGDSLGNKFGYDLSGYQKMYCCKKKIRIIYKTIDKKVVIYVIAIGKRENEKVYKVASKRDKS